MDKDQEPILEEFQIGVIIYLKQKEESLSAMMRVQGLVDPALAPDPELRKVFLMEMAEGHLWDIQNDKSRDWVTFENLAGDRLLVFKDQLDAIRIIAPEME